MPRRLSIAVALIAVLVTVVTALLASFAAVVYGREAARRQLQLQRAVAVNTEQLAAALALPMWNLDDDHIRSIVESGMSDRHVYAIEASTPEQRLRLVRDANWQAVETAAAPTGVELLSEERPVRHKGEVIGQVRLFATPRFVTQELADWRRSARVLILVLDCGLVLSLSLLLWLLLLRPVAALQRYAAAVQAGQAPAVPERALFVGELGALRDSISHMIEMLDSRYRALRDSEQRLKLATGAALIGVWDWDVVADTVVWDEEMHRIHGLPPGQFHGHFDDWRALIVPDDEARAQQAIAAALRGERAFACEFSIRRPDGSTRRIHSEASTTRDAGGRALRMVGVNFDITARHAAEEEVRQLTAGLERRVAERTAQLQAAIDEVVRARDLAESATRAKSEFLANMSHEIRTPMNAVLGMTALALRGELAPRQRDYLEKASSAAESLLGVLNDILDFSKIEAGKLELEQRPFVLQELLNSVHTVVDLRAQQKGLPLHFEVAPAVPPQLVGDRLRLEQVLINLLTNAVKFTERGAITLSVAPVAEQKGDPGMALRFVVTDTGIGMSAEQSTGLFQPFNQLDASTTRKYGGTGLGLAICRRLVTLMGGDIRATSSLGRGSEFSFEVTLGVAAKGGAETLRAPQARHAQRNAVEAVEFAGLRGRHVLLVEDNELNQIVAAELLRDVCGVQVTVAESGADALQALQQSSFDAVLMDVQMPGMDGFEVTRRIRAQPLLASLPIVAMTAHALATDRERCLAAGMNDFVSKPFDPRDLFSTLLHWIAPGSDAAAAEPWADAEAGSLSTELGLLRCMGRTDLYQKIVRRSLETRTHVAEEIQAALEAGDGVTASRLAHTLISTAGTLGAARLSATARDLQLAIEADAAAQTRALLATLTDEHAQVWAALTRYLAGL